MGQAIITTAEQDPGLLWRAYRAFLRTEDESLVCRELGITQARLTQYLKVWEDFKEAVLTAKADRLPSTFENLDDETKAMWIVLSSEGQDEDLKQRALLAVANNGDRERQKLLAWGLLNNHFDVLAALKALKISQKQYKTWLKDPEFADLIDSVQCAKRQFVEGTLMKLVADGDTKAVLFAAERLIKETYGQKIEHSGTIEHQHTANVDLSRLPLELRIQVMEALQGSVADPDGMLIETVEAEAVRRL